jgi:hypothetical protein
LKGTGGQYYQDAALATPISGWKLRFAPGQALAADQELANQLWNETDTRWILVSHADPSVSSSSK